MSLWASLRGLLLSLMHTLGFANKQATIILIGNIEGEDGNGNGAWSMVSGIEWSGHQRSSRSVSFLCPRPFAGLDNAGKTTLQ